MKRTTKRILSVLLTLAMMLSLSVSAMAASKPTITTQPKSVTAAVGDTATFTVKATGATSYQWRYRTATGTTWYNATATGNKTATLKVPVTAAKDGYVYCCRVTNASGTTVSSWATLTVKAAKPVITTQPKDVTAKVGETATFTVKATGATSYQWRYRTATGTTWYNATATGNKTATLKVPVTAAKDGYVYCCRVTNAAGTTVSKWVTLNVAASKPVITTQPVSQNVKSTDSVTFTVKATGATSYQWQYRTSPTGAWKAAAGAGNKTASMTFNPAGTNRNGYQYRCVLKNAAGTTYSNVVTLNITAVMNITAQPKGQNVKTTDSATFTVKATGVKSYQWQYKTPTGKWTNNTCKTDTFTIAEVGAKRHGYQYRCVLTDANGKTVYTDVVTLHVCGITTQPKGQIVSAGGIFTVEAVGDELTYQWQYKKPGGSWANTDGTAASYSPSNEYRGNNYEYRCKVTDAYGTSVTSNGAKLQIITGLGSNGLSGLPQYKKVGETAYFEIEMSGGVAPYTYRWEKAGQVVKEETTDSIIGTYSFTVTEADFNKNIAVYVTDAVGQTWPNSENWSYGVVKEYQALSVKTQPQHFITGTATSISGNRVFHGYVMEFEMGGVGTGDLTYEWQYASAASDVSNSTVWTTLPVSMDGVNTEGFHTNNGAYFNLLVTQQLLDLMGNKGLWMRCKVTDEGTGLSIYTDEALLYKQALTVTAANNELQFANVSQTTIYARVNVSGGRAPYTYTWYYYSGGNWKPIDSTVAASYSGLGGYTSQSLTVTSGFVSAFMDQYGETTIYCRVTDSIGNTVERTNFYIRAHNANPF